MANTVIALKKSATPSSVPSNLANGELAINYADGKLYYKAANGTIASISGNEPNYFGSVNANNTLVVADTPGDVFTLATGNNIAITGDSINDKITIGLTNDVLITGKLNVGSDFAHKGGVFFIDNAAGAGGTDEGGEIQLANATTNQVLSGRVSIDIYQNKLRFFETNSPNRGAFINIASASAGVGTDLLAAASSTDTTARNAAGAAFDKANAANVLAFNALPNTSGVSFNGNLTVSQNLTSDRVFTLNNGIGENFKVGDDAWLGDTNLANAVRLKGQQNASIGYIMFGPNDGKLLGRAGTGDLTYDGNVIWHAGTDGTGSGLDADLLDGQHGTYYGIASDVTAAFAKANSALSNTSGTVFNGDLNIPNLYVGSTNPDFARMRMIESGNISYIQSGTSALFSGRPIHFAPYYSATATMVVDVGNVTVGIARTDPSYTLDIAGTANAANILINGNMVFTAANDGAGSNLDADLLDGQQGSYYGIATDVTAANRVANAAFLHANSGYAFANSIAITANLAFAHANAAFANGNTVIQTAQSVFNQANISFLHANAAFASANAGQASANAAQATANASYAFGNSAHSIANLAFDHANAAFASSNSVNTYSNSTYVKLVAASQTITGNLAITGSLTVSGNAYTIDSQTLKVSDPLIYLAGNNYVSDIVDIGFVANYVNATGSNVHTGLFRDATIKEYYLFEDYDKEPEPNHIDTAGNNFTISVLNATIKTSNLVLGGANAILTIGAAYDQANIARTFANTISINANTLYDRSNASLITANQSFDKANTANITADLAFNKANAANVLAFNALPNTSGVSFAGDLTIPTNLIVGSNVNFDTSLSTKIVDPAANTLAFHTAQTERMRIDNSGNVGIGTTSCPHRLQVFTSNANTTDSVYITGGGGLTRFIRISPALGSGSFNSIVSAGDSGIIYGTEGFQSNGAFVIAPWTTTTSGIKFDFSGNVLIGRTISTVGQNVKLDVAGAINASAVLVNGTALTSGGATLNVVNDIVNATRYLMFANGTSGTSSLNVAVGLAFTPSSNTLNINGALNAVTKSFVIPHPVNEGMFLRYGSLEGPENGVYVRGKIEGKSIIELPKYWWNLIDQDTITVNLTPYGRSQDIWVQSTSAHFIHLNQPADCFFTVFAERKDVDKLVVEY